jgi:hypothetical protein
VAGHHQAGVINVISSSLPCECQYADDYEERNSYSSRSTNRSIKIWILYFSSKHRRTQYPRISLQPNHVGPSEMKLTILSYSKSSRNIVVFCSKGTTPWGKFGWQKLGALVTSLHSRLQSSYALLPLSARFCLFLRIIGSSHLKTSATEQSANFSSPEERRLLGYRNPVCTSQETHYVSTTEPSQLMLCKSWGFHGGDYEECRLLGCYTVRLHHQGENNR